MTGVLYYLSDVWIVIKGKRRSTRFSPTWLCRMVRRDSIKLTRFSGDVLIAMNGYGTRVVNRLAFFVF
jgi:hypothetical protein